MMVDVRCPMCGKTNSAKMEVCQYCQARSTPLVFNPSGEDSDKPGESEEIDEQTTQPRSGDLSEWDIPEWLQSLRPASAAGEGSSAIDQEPPDNEIEDELTGKRRQNLLLVMKIGFHRSDSVVIWKVKFHQPVMTPPG